MVGQSTVKYERLLLVLLWIESRSIQYFNPQFKDIYIPR